MLRRADTRKRIAFAMILSPPISSSLLWLECKTEPVTTPPVVELIRSPALTDRASYAYAAAVCDASRLIFTAGACDLPT